MRWLKNWTVFALALVLIAAFSWSVVPAGFFRVHDYTHVGRIAEMARSLQAGHIPAIWTQNFGYGYGMPLFLFYGPLPYFVGAIFALLGASPLLSLRLLYVLANVLAFFGGYTLMKRWGKSVGLLAGTILLIAPYRAVDLYVRGALSEALAIGILPWILHSVWLAWEKPKAGLVRTSGWTAALLLTHNLTSLIALPFLGLLGIVPLLWTETKVRVRSLLAIAGGFLLGGLMAVFYMIPALTEKGSTIIDTILGGYFDFRLHFLYIRQFFQPNWGYEGSVFGPGDGFSFYLGAIPLALLALSGAFMVASVVPALIKRKGTFSLTHFLKHHQKHVVILLGSILTAVSMWLTLFHSQPVWEAIPALSFIQFPWRYLSITIVLLAIVGSLSLTFIRQGWKRWLVAWILIIALGVTNWSYHRPQGFLGRAEDFYYDTPEQLRDNLSDILPDFLPNTFNRSLPSVIEDQRIVLDPSTPEDSKGWRVNHPHELLLLVEPARPGAITWNIAHFPGWHYYVNDQEVSPQLNENGLMTYTSEANITNVGARFFPTPVRTWTTTVSVLALLVWFFLLTSSRKKSA